MLIFLYVVLGLFFLRTVAGFFKGLKKAVETDQSTSEAIGAILAHIGGIAIEITIGIFALNYMNKTF